MRTSKEGIPRQLQWSDKVRVIEIEEQKKPEFQGVTVTIEKGGTRHPEERQSDGARRDDPGNYVEGTIFPYSIEKDT